MHFLTICAALVFHILFFQIDYLRYAFQNYGPLLYFTSIQKQIAAKIPITTLNAKLGTKEPPIPVVQPTKKTARKTTTPYVTDLTIVTFLRSSIRSNQECAVRAGRLVLFIRLYFIAVQRRFPPPIFCQPSLDATAKQERGAATRCRRSRSPAFLAQFRIKKRGNWFDLV